MKVYIAEFRPRNLSRYPLFWKLAYEIIGTGYTHSGMLLGNRYFEMYEMGYRELPFISYEDLNKYRGTFTANKFNDGDCIDFVELPNNFTDDQIATMTKWWEDNIRANNKFGYARFLELAFWKPFRTISELYHKITGKVLIFAKTDADKKVRVCSSAYDYCLKSIGVDLYPDEDEAITVPGLAANTFPDRIVYRGK